jgi:catechol 2,3-dioxygenase-like lactoylglutathione lyase family enzyme
LKLDHIVLLVGSLEKSLPYYEALLPLLGFEKSREHVWGNADGVYLDFKEAEAGLPGYERYGVGLNHMGFTAPDIASLEHVRDTMAAAGFEVPDVQGFGGTRALFMKDPDGIRFEVTVYG